jgi:alkane 1-monooxygenase
VLLCFGPKAALFAALSGFLSILMLETVNYIEHYGLQRKKDAEGIYEAPNIMHSWNAPHAITNLILFKLQRHSDHHENAYKPYQILLTLPESPVLPFGYSCSIVLALFPSQWFYITNPVAEAANKNEAISPEVKKSIEHRSKVLLISFAAALTLLTVYGFK